MDHMDVRMIPMKFVSSIEPIFLEKIRSRKFFVERDRQAVLEMLTNRSNN